MQVGSNLHQAERIAGGVGRTSVGVGRIGRRGTVQRQKFSGPPLAVVARGGHVTDDERARERELARVLYALRWPDGLVCRCNGRVFDQLHVRPRVWVCRSCGAQSSVTAGTLLHRTKLRLDQWFSAASEFVV